MSDELVTRHCKPCEGGVAPLSGTEVARWLSELHADWQLSADGKWIHREFAFPAYSRSLGFANAVAWIAIAEGHHPDLLLRYGSCEVRWNTHAIDGLSINDFICAAKVDALLE